MNIIIRILINTIIIIGSSYILSGIRVDSVLAALILAIVLGVLNNYIKPILIILTIPATVFTFGLFLIVINGILVWIADFLVIGFEVSNFSWAILFGLILAICNFFITKILSRKIKNEIIS